MGTRLPSTSAHSKGEIYVNDLAYKVMMAGSLGHFG